MGSWARKALSNLSMNRLAYEGAIFVPMAVPWICWCMLLSKLKTLHLSTMLNSSSRMLCGMWEASAVSMASRQASVPSSCWMLV